MIQLLITYAIVMAATGIALYKIVRFFIQAEKKPAAACSSCQYSAKLKKLKS